MQNTTQTLIVIILYLILTVVIGLVASAKQKRQAKEQTAEDFLMAGKSLGALALAGTLFAANTGGASTTGVANNVYRFGLSASWYVIAGGIGFVLISFIAPYFRRAGANTVPEVIGMRFGKRSHIITAITSILALFMATGAQIIATASIINLLTGFDYNTAVLITAVVVLAYTMIGGFASVASANMMHILFITVGMTIAMFIMSGNPAIGGLGNLFSRANEMSAASAGEFDFTSMLRVGIPTILGYIAMYFMTFTTGQEIVQTLASAKDSGTALTGSVMAGVISAAYGIVPALIGLMAYVAIPGFADGPKTNALAAATVEFAHPIIAGLVLSGVVAATISSASGNMIGTATMFSNDLYRPYIAKDQVEEKKAILVSQVAMFAAAIFGVAVALSGSNIISVMMSAFALRSAGPFAAFIFGLFADDVTEKGGFYAILIGTVVAAVWIFVLKSPFGLNGIVPGGLVALAAIYIISKIDISSGGQKLPRLKMADE